MTGYDLFIHSTAIGHFLGFLAIKHSIVINIVVNVFGWRYVSISFGIYLGGKLWRRGAKMFSFSSYCHEISPKVVLLYLLKFNKPQNYSVR